MIKEHPLIASLRESLPAVFTRDVAAKHLGGLLSAKTLANYDARGIGPCVKERIGKKVIYQRDDFLGWLASRFNSGTSHNQQFTQGREKNALYD